MWDQDEESYAHAGNLYRKWNGKDRDLKVEVTVMVVVSGEAQNVALIRNTISNIDTPEDLERRRELNDG